MIHFGLTAEDYLASIKYHSLLLSLRMTGAELTLMIPPVLNTSSVQIGSVSSTTRHFSHLKFMRLFHLPLILMGMASQTSQGSQTEKETLLRIVRPLAPIAYP